MKYVPQAITRTVGRTVLKAQKNSPTLLFVGGAVGVVTATVLACKATLQVEEVLIDHEKTMVGLQGTQLELRDARKQVMVRSTGRLIKLYGPSVLVMSVSIACLTKSHRILTERNTALTAAYVGLQSFLEDYRGRVRTEIGEDKERDVYYSATPVTLVEDGKNGPVKIFGSSPGQRSPYSGIFDETNGNWQDSHEFNVNFIRIQEQLLTDKLRSQGSLLLNEVYDRLDLPRTPNGAICGWMIGHPDSDDFVEIHILPVHDFHGTLMLDFNVAGVVYDMLSGRVSGRRS